MVVRKPENRFEFFYVYILFAVFMTQEGMGRLPKPTSYLGEPRDPRSRIVCTPVHRVFKARRRSCFLRPDTGPCRADILQWYFDVKQAKCFRFFWGGCQGNGNRFDRKRQCLDYCYLNESLAIREKPYFCGLNFDYGTCFGHYYRYGWDKYQEQCKRRLYSGCGGNQNNFQTYAECMGTCLTPPNNTFLNKDQHTTCIPLHFSDFDK